MLVVRALLGLEVLYIGSLKSIQNPAAFNEAQRVLSAFQTMELAGEIDLFYLDESGFSAGACKSEA